MSKHTFKLLYRFDNQTGRTIVFCRRDKITGNYQFLDKKGAAYEVAEYKDEHVKNTMSWSLAQVENIKGTKNTRCFVEKSYVPEDLEKRMTNPDERLNNKITREGHAFLKRHPEVIVKNKNGENINIMIGANPLFELIEESEIEQNELDKNKKKTEGGKVITELYEKSRDQFLEFCYAYNIQVKGATLEQLYNKAMYKLNVNPFEWETVLKNSNYELISKFRKGWEEGLISLTNGYYEFNSEVIGKSEEECIKYFSLNESPRKLLYAKLGYATPEQLVEVKETPAVSKRNISDATMKKMTDRITKALKIMDDEIRAEELDLIRNAFREYIDVVESKILELKG